MKQINWWILGLGVLIGIVWTGLASNYQGKSAKDWAKIAREEKQEVASLSAQLKASQENYDYAIKKASACEKDPRSAACNPYLYMMLQKDNSLVTPTKTAEPYAKMPAWCSATISAYNAAYLPLNYSQGAINEIIKKESPECATY